MPRHITPKSQDSKDEKNWRADLMNQLQAQTELLEKILNHLRVISDINADEGEEY